MRVIFKDDKSKGNFMSNLRNLGQAKEPLCNFSIAYGMTQKKDRETKRNGRNKGKNPLERQPLRSSNIPGEGSNLGQKSHQNKEGRQKHK